MPAYQGPSVRSATVMPSADTNTPNVPIDGSMLRVRVESAYESAQRSGRMLVLPADFNMADRNAKFSVKELAEKIATSTDSVLGLIDSGDIVAFPKHDGARTTWIITWYGVAYYFLRMQGAMN